MASTRMARFDIFIGTWNTAGDVLATDEAPATTLSATDTYRWLPGEHFIVHEVDARFGDEPTRSMEVIGYESAKKKYIARSYDDRGVSEVFEVALKGKRWSVAGKAARFNGKFDAEGQALTGLWELKSRKSGWQPWIRLTLTRSKDNGGASESRQSVEDRRSPVRT
jgi:hypothetical protein